MLSIPSLNLKNKPIGPRKKYFLKVKRFIRQGRYFIVTAMLSSLVACDSGGTSGLADDPNRIPPPPPYWQSVTPDFSVDKDRPSITLAGDKVVILSLNEEYDDPGATASDPQDGNITSNIIIDNQVKSNVVGDYFIRYQVADSSDKSAIDAVRIVRIVDDTPIEISSRPFGSSQSHLGYLEHLPADYGLDPDKKYPLLIYNHGNGANVEFSGADPLGALGALLQNSGPPLLINAGKWDTNLPFIVLMPQFGNIENIDPSARINAFVDYALNTYSVDESKLYFTGWSQGGFLSFQYAIDHGDRVAAIISVSGGLAVDPNNLPDNFCNIENVPIWALHGNIDEVVTVESSIDSIALIEANCQPTIQPRLSILQERNHLIHHAVFNLSAMEGASLGVESDPSFDSYDQSIFEWLLSHDLDER
jgi:hypothetical protein